MYKPDIVGPHRLQFFFTFHDETIGRFNAISVSDFLCPSLKINNNNNNNKTNNNNNNNNYNNLYGAVMWPYRYKGA